MALAPFDTAATTTVGVPAGVVQPRDAGQPGDAGQPRDAVQPAGSWVEERQRRSADGSLAAVFTRTGRYDFRRSLGILQHGVNDPSTRMDAAGSGCWLAFTTTDGMVSLRLDSARLDGADGRATGVRVSARAFGPGAAAALDAVPALLGADDDWAALGTAPLAGALPRFIADTYRVHDGVRLPTAGRVLDFAVIAVLGQKITGLEAKRAWRYLVGRFGSPAPGPAPAGLTVPPTGEQWRRVPSWEWHRAGVDHSRSTTILRVAQRATALERLTAVPCGDDLVAALTSIPGVGPWTAAEITQRTHGDPDAISVGDFHLAKDVGWAFEGGPVDDAGMERILAPWAGHRQRVVRLMYLSGFRRPRFAPRLSPADHRHH